MSRPLGLPAVALDDQILAVLRDRGVPMSTHEICAALGVHRYRGGQAVYRRLAAMAMAGRLERWRIPAWPDVSWSRPAAGGAS